MNKNSLAVYSPELHGDLFEIPWGQVRVIVPTLNMGRQWTKFQPALESQGLTPEQIFIVDSTSDDDTLTLAEVEGYRTISVPRASFHHGRTRQFAADKVGGEFLVFLTQDAILADSNSIRNLLLPFQDPEVGASFGRQLPHLGAHPIEVHARQFNYPPESKVRTLDTREQLGFKAIFSSNSFAAYRRSALQSIGGFSSSVVVSEETVVFAKMLLAGWKTVYAADATVRHSHSYSFRDEFRRYFDIGVLHAEEPWLLKEFGHVQGEGQRFVLSELRSLWPEHRGLILSSLFRTSLKFAGYHAGRNHRFLSNGLARHLSQQKNYWDAH